MSLLRWNNSRSMQNNTPCDHCKILLGALTKNDNCVQCRINKNFQIFGQMRVGRLVVFISIIIAEKEVITIFYRSYLKDINFCEHKFSRSFILANIYFRELLFLLFGQHLFSRISKFWRFCGHIFSRILKFRVFSKCSFHV